MISFVVPIKPRPKRRPQHGKGYTFTPKETREYEALVGFYARRALKRPLEGEITVRMDLYMPIPRSWPEDKRTAAEGGLIRPSSRPDIDNLVKAVLDGMNGIAFKDDGQIVSLTANEWYGEPTRTEVTVTENDNEAQHRSDEDK